MDDIQRTRIEDCQDNQDRRVRSDINTSNGACGRRGSVFQKKLAEIGFFLDKISHNLAEISQKTDNPAKIDPTEAETCSGIAQLLGHVEKLLVFLLEISDFLKKMSKEKIQDVSAGLRDRKTIQRLFECAAFLVFGICTPNGIGMSLDLWKHNIVFNKIFKDQSISDKSLVGDEESFGKNRDVLVMAARTFEIIMKNEVFVSSFNIREKCLLYTLSIYGELGFFPVRDENWSAKFCSLLER